MEKRPTQAAIGDPPRLLQAGHFDLNVGSRAHEAAGLRKARAAGSEQLVYLHQDIIVSNGDISRNRVVQGDGPSLFNVSEGWRRVGFVRLRATRFGEISFLSASHLAIARNAIQSERMCG
jgi:hypothetical protein